MTPDLTAIAALTSSTDAMGLAVFAPADSGAAYDAVVRTYCAADGIPEDPVTGSANANAGIGTVLQQAELPPENQGPLQVRDT